MSTYTLASHLDHLLKLKKEPEPHGDGNVLRFLYKAYPLAKKGAFTNDTPRQRFRMAERIHRMATNTRQLEEQEFYQTLAHMPTEKKQEHVVLGGIGDTALFDGLHATELVLALEREGVLGYQFTRFGIASSRSKPETCLHNELERITARHGIQTAMYTGGIYTFAAYRF